MHGLIANSNIYEGDWKDDKRCRKDKEAFLLISLLQMMISSSGVYWPFRIEIGASASFLVSLSSSIIIQRSIIEGNPHKKSPTSLRLARNSYRKALTMSGEKKLNSVAGRRLVPIFIVFLSLSR